MLSAIPTRNINKTKNDHFQRILSIINNKKNDYMHLLVSNRMIRNFESMFGVCELSNNLLMTLNERLKEHMEERLV